MGIFSDMTPLQAIIIFGFLAGIIFFGKKGGGGGKSNSGGGSSSGDSGSDQ